MRHRKAGTEQKHRFRELANDWANDWACNWTEPEFRGGGGCAGGRLASLVGRK